MFYGTSYQYATPAPTPTPTPAPAGTQPQPAYTDPLAQAVASFGGTPVGQTSAPAAPSPAPAPTPEIAGGLSFGGGGVNSNVSSPDQAFLSNYIQQKAATAPTPTPAPTPVSAGDMNAGGSPSYNEMAPPAPAPSPQPQSTSSFGGSAVTQPGAPSPAPSPAAVAQTPEAAIKSFGQAQPWAQDPVTATKNLVAEAKAKNWTIDQLASSFGFTPQQMVEHIDKYTALDAMKGQGPISTGGPGGNLIGNAVLVNGQAYIPQWEQPIEGTGETAYAAGEPKMTGYVRTAPNAKPGDKMQIYDAQGNFVREDTIKGDDWLDKIGPMLVAGVVGAGLLGAAGVIGGGAPAGAAAGDLAAMSGVGVGGMTEAQLAAMQAAGAGAAGGAGVVVGGPMSTGLPAASALGPAAVAAPAAATGGLAGVKAAVTAALAPLGITGADAAKIAAIAAAASSGGNAPSYPTGTSSTSGTGTGTGSATGQGAEAKAFLDQVLPSIRPDSSNAYGDAKWTKDANGKWTLTSSLNAGNQQLFDNSTTKLNALVDGIDPNKAAPTLIDSVGGQYSSDLARTIYERTMGLQKTGIEDERRAQQARLAEQGFIPGNEGYEREMARWEEKMGEMRNKASMDAQIAAASQALNEAGFTNTSRNQTFQNSQQLQAQVAQILSGARTNTTAGLNSLTTQANAPTGSPGSAQGALDSRYAADLANYQSDAQRQNDMINAIMRLFV